MKQSGYSLIEIIIVMLMMGIIGSSASIGSRLAQKVDFERQVHEVELGIVFARDTATMTGKQYNTYCFSNRVLVRQGTEKPIYSIRLSKDVYIPSDTTGKWIRFYGTMASPKVGTVTLVCKAIRLKADITVRIATGKTTITYKALS